VKLRCAVVEVADFTEERESTFFFLLSNEDLRCGSESPKSERSVSMEVEAETQT